MLSSLAQQTEPSLIAIDVACLPNNGDPTTERVCDTFHDRLLIRMRHYSDTVEFTKRGLIRTAQLQDCKTRWIMFGDCDMVYHLEYFHGLLELLETEYRNATCMLSTGRMSTFELDANELVNSSEAVLGGEVPHAFAQANALPKNTDLPRINVGAGYSQIINVECAPHGGYYVKPDNCRDWDWSRASNYRSDKQFRDRIKRDGGGRVCLPDWLSWTALHLNHARDLDAGRHLEDQR